MYKLGPYEKWEEFNLFNELSDRAFAYFNQKFNQKQDDLDTPFLHLFYRFKYIAESTSASARMINSWTFGAPASVLLRSRFEQLIVCSYLIYEDENIGLKQYIKHGPINDYRLLKKASQDCQLKENLESFVDVDRSFERALFSQKEINPDFELGSKFQPKWSKLNLGAMSHKRDILAKIKSKMYENLEHDYLTIYTMLNSFVHSDFSSVNDTYLKLFEYKGKMVVTVDPYWVGMIMLCCARYDIIQCFEILDYLGIDDDSFYSNLIKEWEEKKVIMDKS